MAGEDLEGISIESLIPLPGGLSTGFNGYEILGEVVKSYCVYMHSSSEGSPRRPRGVVKDLQVILMPS